MTWHLDPALARDYADGSLGGASAASVEAHVARCAGCRGLLAPAAPAARLAAAWAAVEERVDAPRRTWVERLLLRLGVSDHDARLLSAAPSLQLSWLLALTVVLAFAATAALADDRGLRFFLAIAPLVPVAGVAGAYGRGIDPTYETTRATPYPTYRLLLLRVVAVLVVSLVVTGAFALLVTGGWPAAAWLLPSLAMVGVVLVLTRFIELPVAAATVAGVYLLALAGVVAGRGEVVDLFARDGQLVSLTVVLLCLALVLSPTRLTALRRIS